MIYGNNKLKRYEWTEIIVPANSTYAQNFYFNDYPQLRDAKVNKLSAYTDAQVIFNPQGVAIVPQSYIMYCWLILVIGDKEDIKIPISSLITLGEPQANSYALFNVNGSIPLANINIKWSKSYIKFNAAIPATQFSVPFGVFYTL